MYHSLVRSHSTIIFHVFSVFPCNYLKSEQFQKKQFGYLLPQPIIYGNSGNATINIHKENFILCNLFCFKYWSSDENKCLTETLILVTGMELPNQPINFVLFSIPFSLAIIQFLKRLKTMCQLIKN